MASLYTDTIGESRIWRGFEIISAGLGDGSPHLGLRVEPQYGV